MCVYIYIYSYCFLQTVCSKVLKLLVEDEIHLRFVKDWNNHEV